MPSYAHRTRKYPKNRYQILSELRAKNLRREALAEIFDNTIGKLLPVKKPVFSHGYSEDRIKLVRSNNSQKRFQQLVYELKRDGLITEEPSSQLLGITPRGLTWLKLINRKQFLVARPPLPVTEKGNRVTIVSYDVPEKVRAYRRWLRATLRSMNFIQLQQSLWVGKVTIPQTFISDLTLFKIEKCVEIFEITKTGTLRHRL